MIKLGSKVKDSITDLCGTATARVVYLNGCVQYEITSSKLNDGKTVHTWLDEGRCLKVPKKEKTATSRPRSASGRGGPQNKPSGRSHPSSSSS